MTPDFDFKACIKSAPIDLPRRERIGAPPVMHGGNSARPNADRH
jgi:hypothetical protein